MHGQKQGTKFYSNRVVISDHCMPSRELDDFPMFSLLTLTAALALGIIALKVDFL